MEISAYQRTLWEKRTIILQIYIKKNNFKTLSIECKGFKETTITLRIVVVCCNDVVNYDFCNGTQLGSKMAPKPFRYKHKISRM